jgi:DNA-binding SARP family transcriptional activator
VLRGAEGRLAAVVAGAGYGKTVLLGQALAASPSPWVWCSCDARLSDARLLLAHLAAGIAERFPGFGAGLRLEGEADEQVAELCNEVVETVVDDFVLALDDVHLLPDEAASVLGSLVDHLAPNVHLVLAGRAPLPFPVARLRVLRALELGEGQLAFTRVEAGELVRSVGLDVDDEAVERIHRRTEGWAAGLVLAAQSGGGVESSVGDGVEFDYLAEEVFLRQPPDMQELLLDTAILGRFSPGLAAEVSGRPEAGEMVRRLVAGHLFTVRLDDEGEWYRYHHLFQAFLRRRLDQTDPERRRDRHARAARWWLATGDPAQAVPHLLEAGEVDAALDVLEPVAESMALTPQADNLRAWLARVPRERWSRRPGLLLAEASLLFAGARHEAAFAELERAVGELVAANEHDRAAAALFRLQQAMLTAGTSPRLRIEIGQRWRDRIAGDAPLLPAARILLASALGYACRFDEARDELDAALDLPAARGSPVLPLYAAVVRAFYVDFWMASPEKALADLEGAQLELRRRAVEDTLRFLPFAEMLRLYLLNELGRFDRAQSALAAFEAELDRMGLLRTGARAQRWVEATFLAGLGRWDDLGALDTTPPRAPDMRGTTSYSYRYRPPWALMAAHRGDAGEVGAQIAAARVEMEAFGRVFDDVSFLCDFALAAHRAGLDDLARGLAHDALDRASELASPWARAQAGIVAARFEPSEPASDRHLLASLELTGAWGLGDLWRNRWRGLVAPLLTRALDRGLGPPGVRERLLAACGGEVLREVVDSSQDADPTLRARLAEVVGSATDVDLEMVDRLLRDRDPGVREAARRGWSRLKARPRAGIRIETLGDFRVLRDGVVVPSSAFVRQKARALLAALVAASGPVHRETLCEWLWADLPPERAAAALRSTLHDLRRAIEPEVEAGSSLSLLAVDGDSIRLMLRERDGCDVDDLEALTRERAPGESPEVTVGRLLEAESLYRGTFLPEWPFEDWAENRRRRVEAAFLRALEGLAQGLVTLGRPRDAIPRFRRLLAMEPERESWHRDLMRAHAAAGERAMALRQYHACRTVLRREQGIEPDSETRALYQRLLIEEGA